MLRRLFLVFFILANLGMQVCAACACGMMIDRPVVQEHCCCDPDEARPDGDEMADGEDCCQQMDDVADGAGDPVGTLRADIRLPDYKPQPLPPALVPALLSLVLLPVQTHESVWDAARDHGLHGTDLYLRTQRLRL